MSPMAPSRTTKRLSGEFTDPTSRRATSRAAFQPLNERRSGVLFGIAYDFYSPSTGQNRVSLGYALRRVIGALGMNVGADLVDERFNIGFGEDHDRVHIRERGNNLRPFLGRHERPAFSF